MAGALLTGTAGWLFVVFAGLALGAAIAVVVAKNPVHSALYLLLSFVLVACIFILQQAEFVGAVQMLVYAGGIMVLFLFVIMLVNLRDRPPLRPRLRAAFAAAAGLLAIGAMLVAAGRGRLLGTAAGEPGAAATGNLEAVGTALFTEALLPFEIASVLLLVAMVGAIVLARDLGRE